MARLDEALADELVRWETSGLRRSLERDAELGASSPRSRSRAFDFTSNDYLGLATDPRVVEAARAALLEHGAGGRASRLLGGGSPLDLEVEEAVAEWLGAESALLFPSGYQANLGLLTALATREDVVLSDELAHASLVDGARLSRARIAVFRHGDPEELERALVRSRSARRRLVLTEGVFSMDGDLAPLAEMADLCARHDAWLVVDEAHATGLLGPSGAGAWAQASDADPERLLARVVTGGKALGAGGALVVGGRTLRETLVNRARSFAYTTAPTPGLSGALREAVRIARDADGLRERALSVARALARKLGLTAPPAAIVPFVVGENERAVEIAQRLTLRGLDVRAVRPPTVPRGTARLRLACHAHNSAEATELLAAELRAAVPRPDGTSHVVRVSGTRRAARTIAVVGTDTGVGKTVVSALLVRAAALEVGAGKVTYWKPVQTGSDSDSAEVRRLLGDVGARIAPPVHELPLPASPHEAAAAAGVRIELGALRERLGALRAEGGVLIVELAGGLLVPYDEELTQADLLAGERPDIALVARSGLGTLNHTALTIEALESRRLHPSALFLVGATHASNRATLAARSGIEPICELPRLEPLEPASLASWLAGNDLSALFST